jgi:putative membrane protein
MARVASMKYLIRTAAMAGAVWLTFYLVSGLTWDNDWLTLLLIALIIGVVNAFIKPIARLLTLPLRVITLGLFSLVVNIALMAGVLWLASEMDWGVASAGWKSTLIGAVILAVASSIITAVTD